MIRARLLLQLEGREPVEVTGFAVRPMHEGFYRVPEAQLLPLRADAALTCEVRAHLGPTARVDTDENEPHEESAWERAEADVRNQLEEDRCADQL